MGVPVVITTRPQRGSSGDSCQPVGKSTLRFQAAEELVLPEPAQPTPSFDEAEQPDRHHITVT